MLLVGLLMLVLALPPFFDFPWLRFWLLPLAAIYLFLLFMLPRLWLFVLPLVTVGVDITPFTGRFAYNELDLVFIVTLSSGLLYNRYRFKVFAPDSATFVLFLYFLVIILGYSGWAFFALPPGAEMGNPYYTSEYAYKVLKGMLWGVALVPMWGFLLAVDKRRTVNALVVGMSFAALLLGLIVLWERGALDLSSSYRVTGIFSDMHTGGEAFGGVVLLLLPATLYAATYGRAVGLRVLGAAGFLTLAYVTLVGFNGATYATFAIAVVVYTLLAWRPRRGSGMSLSFALAGFCIALAVNAHFSRVGSDLEARENHWKSVIDSAGGGFFKGLLGNGVGSFPMSYISKHPEKKQEVGSFSVVREDNLDVLRIGGGRDLTLGQRVTVEPYTNYTFNIHLRAAKPARVLVGLCERNVIYASKFMASCLQTSLKFDATDGAFVQQTLEINSGRIGERRSLWRWPTVVTIQYDKPDTVLEINAVDLSADGYYVLRNSSFKQGLDYWFSYSDFPHLPWHAKNAFLQVWFETGWLGLCLFLSLIALLIRANFRRHAYDSLIPVYTTGVLAICAFGLFGSPLDSARVSWMFYFFLAAGLARLRVKGKRRSHAVVTGPVRL